MGSSSAPPYVAVVEPLGRDWTRLLRSYGLAHELVDDIAVQESWLPTVFAE